MFCQLWHCYANEDQLANDWPIGDRLPNYYSKFIYSALVFWFIWVSPKSLWNNRLDRERIPQQNDTNASDVLWSRPSLWRRTWLSVWHDLEFGSLVPTPLIWNSFETSDSIEYTLRNGLLQNKCKCKQNKSNESSISGTDMKENYNYIESLSECDWVFSDERWVRSKYCSLFTSDKTKDRKYSENQTINSIESPNENNQRLISISRKYFFDWNFTNSTKIEGIMKLCSLLESDYQYIGVILALILRVNYRRVLSKSIRSNVPLL